MPAGKTWAEVNFFWLDLLCDGRDDFIIQRKLFLGKNMGKNFSALNTQHEKRKSNDIFALFDENI